MKRIIVMLALLAMGWGIARAASPPADSAATDRLLLVDSSSMRIGTSKATLIIGPLRRAAGVYTGDYKLKVFPYFFKNENGRLAILVSDEILAEVSRGKAATIVGTATTSGKNCKSRPIGATATPVDINRGTLKLWFMAGDRKMIFAPAYHFAGVKPAVALAQPAETGPKPSLKCRLPASPRVTLEIANICP
jgi:hypothetical protein